MARRITGIWLLILTVSCGWGAPTPLVPGCRIQALSGAFVGLADDANAVFYNPAGVAYHQILSSDISMWRTDDGQLGGLSIMYINPSSQAGNMVGIGWVGTGLTTATSEERAGAIVLPTLYSPSRGVPIGVGLKAVYGRNASGTFKWKGTVDVGTLVQVMETVRIGAVIRNAYQTKLTAFPTVVRVGGAWKPIPILTMLLDVETDNFQEFWEGEATWAAGIEAAPVPYATFQAGMQRAGEETLFSVGAETRQNVGGSSIGIGYWFPSDDINRGWFSLGFAYRTR